MLHGFPFKPHRIYIYLHKRKWGVAPRVKLNNEHLFYGKIFVVTCFCIKIDDNQSSERHW